MKILKFLLHLIVLLPHGTNLWPFNVGRDFALGNSLFGAFKLNKNTTDFDKFKYSGYGIESDARRRFSLSNRSGFDKNVIIFGADMSSSVHTENKEKDILILVKGSTNGLEDTTLSAKKLYLINFTEQQNKFCLIFHYNGVNSYLFVSAVEI